MHDDGHITTIITFPNAAEIRQIDPFPNYYCSLIVCKQRQVTNLFLLAHSLEALNDNEEGRVYLIS